MGYFLSPPGLADCGLLMHVAVSLSLLLILFFPRVSFALDPLTPLEHNLITEAKQGQIVRLPELLGQRASIPRIGAKIVAQSGAQLLLSDRPEYFARDGISLQETVKPGKVRLYVYHVPQPDTNSHTISAVLKNCGTNVLNLRVTRRAFPTPGRDYQQIALKALVVFLKEETSAPRRQVFAGQSCVIDELLDQSAATKDQLAHGFFEFEIDQPSVVTVFQRSPAVPSLEALPRLPLLSTDPTKRGNGAGRGLFPVADFLVENEPGVLDSSNGPVQLIVADGKTDPWIKGYDSIDHTNSIDAGNYGVFYHIRLRRNPEDRNGLALLLCKIRTRSAYCGRLAAAMEISRGEWPAGVVALPAGPTSLENADDAVLVQRFPPPKSPGDETIEILFSPPGAACLPTPLVFVPYRPARGGPP
jgi:hypothetical protein